ncbi:MAG TPA: FAD-dependent oxidoreductase [Patescibacteria group bacterium]
MNTATFHFPLVRKRQIAENTFEFTFNTQNTDYLFRPGQYAYVSLIHHNLGDQSRIFSFVNAPRPTGEVIIAARIRAQSDYKQALAHLQPGEVAEFSRALGFFDLPANKGIPIVMMAGGIGIVPFLSLLESEAHAASTRPIELYISHQSPESEVYMKEIKGLAPRLPNLILHQTYTQKYPTAWHGKKGRFTTDDFSFQLNTHFYVAGTPAMTDHIISQLRSLDIPLSHIFMEAFSGYEI